MLSRRSLLVLLFGALIVAPCLLSPVRAAEQDEEDDEYLDEDEVQEVPEDDGRVVTLTADNFDKVVKENKHVLVEFYAPWCGHCQALAPEYVKASLTLAEEAPDVVLAKVDATTESSLSEKYGVQGFPTLFWFKDGKESEYTGGREEPTIVRWILKRVGPAATTASSTEELTTVEAENDLIMVGYFQDLSSETRPELAAFQDACREMDFECIQTSDATVAQAAGVSEGSLSVITKFPPTDERNVVAYSGTMDKDDIVKFVKSESLPTVVPFVGEYSERIFSVGVQNHLIFVGDAASLDPSQGAFKAFNDVAAEYKGKGEFVFVSVDAKHEDAEPVVSFFELEDASYPVLFGFQLEPNQRKFSMSGEITEATLKSFATGMLDGSTQPDLKSDDIPDEDMDGNVKVIVGKSFDDVVKDPTKDVLLEVYAPWCGHCQNLEPIYKKLAARFKDIDSVVIGKMDGTTNEHADLSVEGFPYIAFYPAKEGASAVQFSGERSLKALTKFIKEHAVVPYELKKKPESATDAKDEL